MKEEEYISKGDLELYALDVLSHEERKEVSAQLGTESVQNEMSQIEETLERLAERGSIKPDAHLKSRVMASLDKTRLKTGQIHQSHRLLMAAAISMTLVSGLLAYFFWNQWQTTKERLEIALNESSYLADQSRFTIQKLDELRVDMKVLSDPAFLQITLNGTENAPDHQTFVYWNSQSKETYLQVSQLKPLTDDQQYQLWSIQEGKPVDAGVFDLDEPYHLIKMKANENPQAFAITIEPRGGSTSPTLVSMVVIGNVSV